MGKNESTFVKTKDKKSQILFQVVDIKPAKPLEKKESEALRSSLQSGISTDIDTQYMNGLKKTYGVEIDAAAIQKAIGK
jgi:hypothetical protein